MQFIVLIAGIQLLVVMQVGITGYILMNYSEESEFRNKVSKIYLHSDNENDDGYDVIWYAVIIGVGGVISFIVSLFNGHLICFHIWLRCNGLTTYQYILNNRKKRARVSDYRETPQAENSLELCYEPYVRTNFGPADMSSSVLIASPKYDKEGVNGDEDDDEKESQIDKSRDKTRDEYRDRFKEGGMLILGERPITSGSTNFKSPRGARSKISDVSRISGESRSNVSFSI